MNEFQPETAANSTFPNIGGSVPAQGEAPAAEQLPPPRRIQPLHLALAGLGIVVIGAGAFWFTRGDSPATTSTTPSKGVGSSVASNSPGVARPSLNGATVVATRDPFKLPPTTTTASPSGGTGGSGATGGTSTVTNTTTVTNWATTTETSTSTSTSTSTKTITVTPTPTPSVS